MRLSTKNCRFNECWYQLSIKYHPKSYIPKSSLIRKNNRFKFKSKVKVIKSFSRSKNKPTNTSTKKITTVSDQKEKLERKGQE